MNHRHAFFLIPLFLISCSDPDQVSFRELNEEAVEDMCYDQILDDLLADGDVGELEVELEDYPDCTGIPRLLPSFECVNYKKPGTHFYEMVTGNTRPADGLKCCLISNGIPRKCKQKPYP